MGEGCEIFYGVGVLWGLVGEREKEEELVRKEITLRG